MKKNKKKKKFHFKKTTKGFTLVELLAVIVILAIIMIIAIPSVINTLEQAKKKSMIEFAQKVMKRAEEINVENQLMRRKYPLPAEKTYIIYDIRKDLGLSSVGDYYGVISYVVMNNESQDSWYQIMMYDSDYLLNYNGYYARIDPNMREFSVENNITSSSEFENLLFNPAGKNYKDFDFADFMAYTITHRECNYQDVAAVSGGTRQQLYSTKPGRHSSCSEREAEEDENKVSADYINKVK